MVRMVRIMCIKLSDTIQRPVKNEHIENLKLNWLPWTNVNTGAVINSIIPVLDVEP
jgi:phage baseplate assembly protein gpV